MVKKVVQHFWEAEVVIKTLVNPGIAFAVQTEETKEKGRKITQFRLDWLDGNGKVMFDVGSRLRGWLKMQCKTIRPSLGDVVSYGVRVLTEPVPGMQAIAEAKDLEGWGNPPTSITDYYKLPDGIEIAYPIKEAYAIGEGKQKHGIFSFFYLLHKPIELKAKIFSFARGLDPEQVEWALTELGKISGIGDKYSRGYGLFTLESFKILENKEMPL